MNVLVLAPHTDDEAFGCGGAIAKHAERGDMVHTIAFSTCGKEELADEARAASMVLGSSIEILDFPVRRFDSYRQDILEVMVQERERFRPDVVYLPCSSDIHQDHKVVYDEGFRAFKHCTVLGYELPWNCRTFTVGKFDRLEGTHVEKKTHAIRAYKSQAHRPYSEWRAISSQLSFRGLQAGCYYAEAFEVIRWIS